MTNLIPNFSPNWTNRNPADFGMTLIELFAYMGDILNYYIDRTANEALITTATQRQSVLDFANILGYTPSPSTASTVFLTFLNNSIYPVTIPALTQVATSQSSTLFGSGSSSQIIFEVDPNSETSDGSYTLPAASGGSPGSYLLTATQGYTVSPSSGLGVSTGAVNQTYQLPDTNVIANSIKVTISGTSYQQVNYLSDYSGYDPVFSAKIDENNITTITFGDGISGRIPPTGATIFVTYRVGAGAAGNVQSGAIQYIVSWPGSSSVPSGVSVLNLSYGDVSAAATGGADVESTDSIRVNAPLSVRTLNRAVSVDDYGYLASQIVGVSSAIGYANTYNAVTVYVLPEGDPGVASDNSTPTNAFYGIAGLLSTYFENKVPGSTSVVFQPPYWVGINLVINLTVLPTYTQASVVVNVTQAINNLLDPSIVFFGQTVSVGTMYNVINSVDGVAYSQIVKMVRADQDQSFNITTAALTSNVVTLTTSSPHNIVVGQTIEVLNLPDPYNGTFVVTAVGTSTVSYVLVNPNIASASVSGYITVLATNDIVCFPNEIPMIQYSSSFALGALTISPSGGI